MLKNLKVQTKIIVLVSASIILSFAIIFSIILINLYNSGLNQAQTLAFEVSKGNAIDVKEDFTLVEKLGKGLGISIEKYRKKGIANRQAVIDMQKQILKSDESIFGIAVAYEPNIFDGKDQEFVGQSWYGSNGEFIPYITRDGNGYNIEPAYTESSDKRWYNETKK